MDMSTNAKQILNNLYGLMMEINYYRTDEDVLTEYNEKPDAQVNNHLIKIRQISAKLQAENNKARYAKAIEQIEKLKERGIEEFKKLFNTSEQAQLIPMFNKFTELSKKDEAAILEDQEMLRFMEILKNRVEDSNE